MPEYKEVKFKALLYGTNVFALQLISRSLRPILRGNNFVPTMDHPEWDFITRVSGETPLALPITDVRYFGHYNTANYQHDIDAQIEYYIDGNWYDELYVFTSLANAYTAKMELSRINLLKPGSIERKVAESFFIKERYSQLRKEKGISEK